jgi:hypothetical protein
MYRRNYASSTLRLRKLLESQAIHPISLMVIGLDSLIFFVLGSVSKHAAQALITFGSDFHNKLFLPRRDLCRDGFAKLEMFARDLVNQSYHLVASFSRPESQRVQV